MHEDTSDFVKGLEVFTGPFVAELDSAAVAQAGEGAFDDIADAAQAGRQSRTRLVQQRDQAPPSASALVGWRPVSFVAHDHSERLAISSVGALKSRHTINQLHRGLRVMHVQSMPGRARVADLLSA